MNASDQAGLTIDGLTVSFDGRVALDQVSLRIEPGTSLALIGPNGSGKSTLLNVIAGLVPARQGRVGCPPGTTVAYVLQHYHREHWLPLTVGEVLQMGRYGHRGLLGRMRPTDTEIVRRAATRMDVLDLIDQPFDQLSGGQRQRVLVAQALAQEPTILLMDEPITGLDLASQHAILDLIDTETERGTTVLVTTHHLDEARHCDRVAILAGRLVAVGPPPEVLAEEILREAFGHRVLGDHDGHDHETELLIFDDHGHHH